MAKKLTDEQIEKLGDALIDTSKNIYSVCRSLFEVKGSDEDFDRLRKISKIFKCEECNRWWPISEESDRNDICQDCQKEEIYREEEGMD